MEQRRLPRMTPDELLRCSPKDLTKRRLEELFKIDAQDAEVVMDADGDRDQQHHQETPPQTVGPAESGWGWGAAMPPKRYA